MITIFSPMRPFRGLIGEVQLNAIRSWKAVRPRCEVMLVDDEEGTTTNAVRDLGVRVIREVRRSPMGAPLLDDLLRVGAVQAAHPVLAYITADVLLPPDTADVVLALHDRMQGNDYFAVAGRYDMLRSVPLEFEAPDWFERLKVDVQRYGRQHAHTAIDLWVYPKALEMSPPPMPIGRAGSDGWAVWDMRRRSVPVVDLTDSLLLVHQFHDKPTHKDPRFDGELRECVRLFDGMAEKALSLLDADWLFRDGQLRRPRGLRRLHAEMSFFKPYRFLVGQRRRRNLPHWYGSPVRTSTE